MLRPRKGFTLVELLVVIGIIALLISILLPSLKKSKVSANTVVCASNLRQLHMATVSYANANKGYHPVWSTSGVGANWHRRIYPYVSKNGTYDSWGVDYVRAVRGELTWIYNDPGDALADHSNAMTIFNLSYAYNGCLRTTKLKFKSTVINFIDMDIGASGSPIIAQGTLAQNLLRLRGRHNGRDAICWEDGHVTQLTPKEIPTAADRPDWWFNDR
jgi:prepilin-type N-terminal cleavage/methylation domain-containing protein